MCTDSFGDIGMFSEKIPNWTKIIDSVALTVKAIATQMIPEPTALLSARPFTSRKTSLNQMNLETQRDQAMANLRLVNLNR
jgi:hypothetical protein